MLYDRSRESALSHHPRFLSLTPFPRSRSYITMAESQHEMLNPDQFGRNLIWSFWKGYKMIFNKSGLFFFKPQRAESIFMKMVCEFFSGAQKWIVKKTDNTFKVESVEEMFSFIVSCGSWVLQILDFCSSCFQLLSFHDLFSQSDDLTVLLTAFYFPHNVPCLGFCFPLTASWFPAF